MARAFLTAQKSYLAGSMLALCNCVRIVRLDGRVYTFTSLDVDLVIAGETYLAYTSVDATELAAQIGSGVDNLSVVALLSSTVIKETELLAGLWDGAKVELFMFSHDQPVTVGKLGPLLTGTIGEITEDGGQFTAEVRGLSQRLSQQFVALCSPLCRHRAVGDRFCMPKGFNEGQNGSVPTGSVTMAAARFSRTVTVVNSTKQITFGGDASSSGLYRYSPLVFTAGANVGLAREVKEHTQGGGSTAVITLQEAFPYPVQIGDIATLEKGCNRTLAICNSIWGNTSNYGGEPFIPGNDSLLRVGRR
jgi:uncharacterized phage protein (TIGR02218 family)